MSEAILNPKAEILRKWRESGGKSGPPKTPWEKLEENPKSFRAAITAKCADCMGFGVGEKGSPGWKEDVRNCTSPRCPLYGFRPYQ